MGPINDPRLAERERSIAAYVVAAATLRALAGTVTYPGDVAWFADCADRLEAHAARFAARAPATPRRSLRLVPPRRLAE